MSDSDDNYEEKKFKQRSPKNSYNVDQTTELLEQNQQLRRKLKKLSSRLDEELEKAAKQKLKANLNPVQQGSQQSQSLELQNAYKMIERLQKSVKDYESKESYQVSLKRILDLESIIKKKQAENEELKLEVKTTKKLIRQKQKHVSDLLDKQAVNPNLNEEKEEIQKLKNKIKKLLEENDELKKKEMSKHKKLVSAERKIVEMEQVDEEPIGRQEQLLDKLEEYKGKYKEAMVRIEKQNLYITKLNTKLSTFDASVKQRRAQSYNSTNNEKQISRSVDQLPDLNQKKIQPSVFDHIPSPNIPQRLLRRY